MLNLLFLLHIRLMFNLSMSSSLLVSAALVTTGGANPRALGLVNHQATAVECVIITQLNVLNATSNCYILAAFQGLVC